MAFSWRFIPYCGTLFADLESLLSSCFCVLFGVEVSAAVRQLFSLPFQFGGLVGMFNPVAMSAHCYDSSVHSTMPLRKSILGGMTFELDAHIETVSSAKCFDRQFKFEHFTNIFD